MRRPREQLLVDVVGRDRHLADVVEKVVEQDLRRQHRQERQKQRRACGGKHVAEVGRRSHQDVLDRVGEDPPALDDTVGDDPKVLVEQDDVGGVLGDVGGGVDGDPDVGVVQGDGVVHAVAEEADVHAGAALRENNARLLLRRHAREHRRPRQSREQLGIVHRGELASGDDRARVEADLATEVCRDGAVVAGDDLDGDAEPVEAGERLVDVGLGWVGEAEETVEGEVALVVAAEVLDRDRAACDSDDTRAGREQAVEGRLGLGGHRPAARQHRFGSALGDDQPAPVRRVDEDRGQLPLMVERQEVERRPVAAVPSRGLGGGLERPVELVARLVAARETERAHAVVGPPRQSSGPVKEIAALGERAGLVREQHLDVAEVLDADEALHDHPSSRQTASARRQADGHDRRQQLRRQANGDREREESRLEDRTSERDVDHEDRARQHHGDGREQTREGLQPLLERGLSLPLAEPQGDRAERSVRARPHDEAAPVTAAHERAHERARRQIER